MAADVNSLKVKNAENKVREFKNWMAIFADEYSLPEEAVDQLEKQTARVARLIGDMTCKPDAKIDENRARNAENGIRDLKNWVFVFADEYDLEKEAVNTLQHQIEMIVNAVGEITCVKKK